MYIRDMKNYYIVRKNDIFFTDDRIVIKGRPIFMNIANVHIYMISTHATSHGCEKSKQ